jgi:hypothetical protein
VYLFILGLSDDAYHSWDYSLKFLLDTELGRTWKKASVAQCEVLTRNLPERIEAKCEMPQPVQVRESVCTEMWMWEFLNLNQKSYSSIHHVQYRPRFIKSVDFKLWIFNMDQNVTFIFGMPVPLSGHQPCEKLIRYDLCTKLQSSYRTTWRHIQESHNAEVSSWTSE